MSVISKPIADFLRNFCISHTSTKIKASHAHEMVAAFFGYKSNISLVNDNVHPLSALKEAGYLIPNVALMDERRTQLKDFPEALPASNILAKAISDHIKLERQFVGEVWLTDEIETYIAEEFLPSIEETILDELSGVMAETNATFDSSADYDSESVVVMFNNNSLEISATGVLSGSQLEDKMFSGDDIAFEVYLSLPIVAGKRCFGDIAVKVVGAVIDDWRDKPSQITESPTTALNSRAQEIASSANAAPPAVKNHFNTLENTIGKAATNMFKHERFNALATKSILPAHVERHLNIFEKTIGKTAAKILQDQERINKLTAGIGLPKVVERHVNFLENTVGQTAAKMFEDHERISKLARMSALTSVVERPFGAAAGTMGQTIAKMHEEQERVSKLASMSASTSIAERPFGAAADTMGKTIAKMREEQERVSKLARMSALTSVVERPFGAAAGTMGQTIAKMHEEQERVSKLASMSTLTSIVEGPFGAAADTMGQTIAKMHEEQERISNLVTMSALSPTVDRSFSAEKNTISQLNDISDWLTTHETLEKNTRAITASLGDLSSNHLSDFATAVSTHKQLGISRTELAELSSIKRLADDLATVRPMLKLMEDAGITHQLGRLPDGLGELERAYEKTASAQLQRAYEDLPSTQLRRLFEESRDRNSFEFLNDDETEE